MPGVKMCFMFAHDVATFSTIINADKYDALSARQKQAVDKHCNTGTAPRVGAEWGTWEDAGRQKLKAAGHPGRVPVDLAAAAAGYGPADLAEPEADARFLTPARAGTVRAPIGAGAANA